MSGLGGLYGTAPFSSGGSYGTYNYGGFAGGVGAGGGAGGGDSILKSPALWLGILALLLACAVGFLYTQLQAPDMDVFIHPGGGEIETFADTGGVGRHYTKNVNFHREVTRYFRLRAGHTIVGAWYGNGVSAMGPSSSVYGSPDVTDVVRAWLPGDASSDVVYRISSGDVFRKVYLAADKSGVHGASADVCYSGSWRVGGKVNPLMIVTRGPSLLGSLPSITNTTVRAAPSGAISPEVETKQVVVNGLNRTMMPECYTQYQNDGLSSDADIYAKYAEEVAFAVPAYGVQSTLEIYKEDGVDAQLPSIALDSEALRTSFLPENASGVSENTFLAFARNKYFMWALNAQFYRLDRQTGVADAAACAALCSGSSTCAAWEWHAEQCDTFSGTASAISSNPSVDFAVSGNVITRRSTDTVLRVGGHVTYGSGSSSVENTIISVAADGESATLDGALSASDFTGQTVSLIYPVSLAPAFDDLPMEVLEGGYAAYQ